MRGVLAGQQLAARPGGYATRHHTAVHRQRDPATSPTHDRTGKARASESRPPSSDTSVPAERKGHPDRTATWTHRSVAIASKQPWHCTRTRTHNTTQPAGGVVAVSNRINAALRTQVQCGGSAKIFTGMEGKEGRPAGIYTYPPPLPDPEALTHSHH